MSTGVINSRAREELNIVCSGTASLNVAVGNTELPLISSGNNLTSQLYVGADGQQMFQETASPTATIPLISTINTKSQTPGTFIGSKVIYVNWD